MSSSAKLLELKYDEGKLRASLVSLSKVPEKERTALARAINKALYGTRTDIVADLRSRTVLKAGIIRKGVSVNTVWWFSHSWARGYVRVSSGRLPLTEYKVTPMRQTAQPRKKPSQYKPLRYVIEKGGKSFDNTPRDESRSKLFMIRGHKSGALKVFTRLGPERLPIVTETGPSLQFFYGRDEYSQYILKKADARFRKELAHQISHLAGGGR